MSASGRFNFRGHYRVVHFDNQLSEIGEDMVVYNPQDLQFIVDNARDVFSLYPEESYDFNLLIDNDEVDHQPKNDRKLVELRNIQQVLANVSTSHMNTSMTSSMMGKQVKRLSLNLVIQPRNFIFAPVVLCTSDQFPGVPFRNCPSNQNDMDRQQVLVAIDINESFSDVTKRILSKFLTFWRYPIEDVNFSDFVLSLFLEDGCQHVDSSTLRHNELIVFKMETFDNKLLQMLAIAKPQQQPSSISLTPPRPNVVAQPSRPNPRSPTPESTQKKSRGENPLLDQLREFMDGCGIVLTEEAIMLLRQQGDTLEALSAYLFNNLEELQSPRPRNSVVAQPRNNVIPPPRSNAIPPPPEFVIPPEVCTRECKICMETFPMEEMYILNCSQNHSFCIACLSQQIHINITPSSDSAGVIPACSCANGEGGCRYTLTLHEIEQILQLAVDQDMITVQQRAEDLKRVKKMFFVSGCISAGNICCPNCPSNGDSEGSWFDVGRDQVLRGAPVTCPHPDCELTFCCKCRASPYHYKCTCEEVVAYERFWLDWNAHGRRRYQEELSARDAQYRAAMERARADHEKKVAEARARFEATKQSEREMAKRYKMCPQCSAPIEHISGCDLMVCGRDYHGNPIGNGLGCGANFRWTSAPPYAPRTGEEQIPADAGLVEPERAKDVEHLIMEGYPITCDYCRDPIVGPLIRCINCPAFDICFKCSSTVDFGRDPHGHNNTHICTVIFETKN